MALSKVISTLGLLVFLFSAMASAAPSASLLSAMAPSDLQIYTWLEANSDQTFGLVLDSESGILAFEPQNEILFKTQATLIAQSIRGLNQNESDIELESYPVENSRGRITFAFSRYRELSVSGASSEWVWLDQEIWNQKLFPGYFDDDYEFQIENPALPIIATRLDTGKSSDLRQILLDPLKVYSLYDRPAFSDCVWVDSISGSLLTAWLPSALKNSYSVKGKVCYQIAQPARLAGNGLVFVLKVSRSGEVTLPEQWQLAKTQATKTVGEIRARASLDQAKREVNTWLARFGWADAARELKFSDRFLADYRKNVMALSGELPFADDLSEALSVSENPQSITRFKKKNSAQVENDLPVVVAYLESKYRALGIETERQVFSRDGGNHVNLIAKIPGKLRKTNPTQNRPIILADHIDTAFSEDIFSITGLRISNPGADDNATATATLLQAAVTLQNQGREHDYWNHDIWFVHLTGEEFPTDCLGARYFFSEMLRRQQQFSGMILMDLIGFRGLGVNSSSLDPVFQINAGAGPVSKSLSELAFQNSKTLHGEKFEAKVRAYGDPKNYIYNTDGFWAAKLGFPIVYLNEHLNTYENLFRPGYHSSRDRSTALDFDYATAIAKVAIVTAVQVASH